MDNNTSESNNSIFEIINNTLKGNSSFIESNESSESIHDNISYKIEEISLVKYVEPEKDESIRDFFAKEINSSVSIEPVNVSSDLKKEIYTIILDSLTYGSDTGSSIEGFDAKVYPLIVDEDIGNPGYLSRKNGIKISFLTDDGKSPVGNSIWAYKRYATNIIRQIYQSRYGE
ncbi:MAG: hypothetical protein PHV39_08505 [Methanomicrobium sp.]|nr:hypothetical protein [Methanomicrobium sp.]